jgi:DNA repair exonuclease SbcCD nuclease subunit
MKVLFIGDIHIKHNNVDSIDVMIKRLSSNVTADIAVLAGDILDTHEKIDTQLMNKAYELVRTLRNQMHVYILVGNHDYINNQQFLTDNHWMNGMKEWANVTVVDTPIVDHGFVFVPYVPSGRFVEALNDIDWISATCIYAHQEFKGCRMGAIISDSGDEWNPSHPLVISGHIHEPQRPQENIIYPGSAINHSFGYDSQGVSVFDFNGKTYGETKIDLGFIKKNIVYMSVDKAKKMDVSRLKKTIKFSIEGSLQDIKVFKESPEYKKMIKESKVVLKIIKSKTPRRFMTRSFQSILEEMVIVSKDVDLINDYKNVISI